MVRAFDRASFAFKHDLVLGELFERLARIHGNRHLVTEADGGLDLSYQQAAKRISRWAGGIIERIAPGDPVVVAGDNGIEQLLLCLAVSRAGGLPAPVNDKMTAAEIEHVVNDSGATLVLRSAADVDGAEPLTRSVAADPHDIAALFYTSGTTGAPKGAALSHRSLTGSISTAVVVPSNLRRDEVVMSLPVAHIMGFAALLGMAAVGIPTYFIPRFRPDTVLDAIETRRATMFVGVPAMYRMMLDAGAEDRDLKSVRVWASGADVMPSDQAAEFKRMGATATLPIIGPVGQATFVEGYGMVEVGGGVATKISPPFLPIGLGDSVGFPLPSYKMRVVDEEDHEVAMGQTGELQVKGPGILNEYWHAPEATAAVLTEDGWLRTGDAARRGPFGTVGFAGRIKDVIMHGGYSVYAVEVEADLEEHPSIAEAAVVGLPDERLGESVAAAVRIEPGATFDEDAIRTFCEQRMSDYKIPSTFLVVEDFPRTGTEKIQRREVVSLFD